MGPQETLERGNQEQALRDEWARLLATESGRALFYSIIRKTRVFDATISEDRGAHFNEGLRYVGLDLMASYLRPASVHAAMVVEEEERAERIAVAREADMRNGYTGEDYDA